MAKDWQQLQLEHERIYQQLELELFNALGVSYDKTLTFYENSKSINDWIEAVSSQKFALEDEAVRLINTATAKAMVKVKTLLRVYGIEQLRQIDISLVPYMQANSMNYINPEKAFNQIVKQFDFISRLTLDNYRSSIFQGLEIAYNDLRDVGLGYVLKEGVTLREGVTKAMIELAEKGIPISQKADNAMYSMEGYLGLNSRNQQKAMGNMLTEARLDDYDVDLVMVSSHLDSRPEHAELQGRIFSRNGNSDKYPALSSTGYGNRLTGLCTGINCRHVIYAYFEGITNKPYQPYDTKDTDYHYKMSQRQRYLERQIRKAKKREQALESLGADEREISKADRLVKMRQQRMRQFIEDSGRTRRRKREQLGYEKG